ncbi:PLAT/LH2 domain-containing protein [Sagittula salina]|uniref:PLAT domain-containing protein n=1 Tax=Sagittula salina TaxID=2820268 RepID=A0A940MN23_9RHOB|nr:hypothetical protein [Sagittula salina]
MGSHIYIIRTKTSDNPSGKAALIKLKGTRAESHPEGTDEWGYTLDNRGEYEKNDFEKYATDTFRIESNQDLGDIYDIQLKLSVSGGWWGCEWVEIEREGSNRNLRIPVNATIKREPAIHRYIDLDTEVSLDGNQESKIVSTEWRKFDFISHPDMDKDKTMSPIVAKVSFKRMFSNEVTFDRTSSHTLENAWMFQGGYTASKEGGWGFTTGFSGKVVDTIEKQTGIKAVQAFEVVDAYDEPVPPGVCMVVQCDWLETGQKGIFRYYDDRVPFEQLSRLTPERKVFTYTSHDDMPQKFKDLTSSWEK